MAAYSSVWYASARAQALKLQTMAEVIPLSADDVLREETSGASLMPPGLLDGIATDEVRDLISYLMTK